jgi:hypothetical protein
MSSNEPNPNRNETMTTATEQIAYRINHANQDVFCAEAYGMNHHPVFTSKTEAVAFMRDCINAWPTDCKEREMYSVREFDCVEAAMADGHAVLM